jgi:hypothetical protein
MNKYAIVINGIVDSLAMAEAPQASNWVPIDGEYPQPTKGWLYDSVSFTFKDPGIGNRPSRYNRITAEAFWERFSPAELVDYEIAMQHDPTATKPHQKDAAKLRLFQKDTNSTGFRKLLSNKVVNFVKSLEIPQNTVTILAADRADIITGTKITDSEAYDSPFNRRR